MLVIQILTNDPRREWTSSDLTGRNYDSEGSYEVTTQAGNKFRPPKGRYWVVKREKFLDLDREKRIWWGSDGKNMPRLKRFLSEVKQGIVPQTLWKYEDVGHTQEAKKELLEFVDFENTDNVLDTVKPTRLIERMLQLATKPSENELIVDFFAGSGSTAHAVFKQNKEDGGNRRFIMVQLPEPLPVQEKTLKTIADIGKQRIQRVAERMQKDSKGKLDLGCKFLKLNQSNFRPWEDLEQKEPAVYSKQMELHVDPLTKGWKPENVIWEVAIKEGYSLTSKIEKTSEAKNATVYRVSDPDKDQSFHICFDDKIKLGDLKSLHLTQDDLFICRDIALDDEAAANLALQCRLKTI